MRKERGLGEGESLYLKRRYNLQNGGKSMILTPDRKDRLNQTTVGFANFDNVKEPARDESGPLSPRNLPEKLTPRDPYFDKLIVTEDPVT